MLRLPGGPRFQDGSPDVRHAAECLLVRRFQRQRDVMVRREEERHAWQWLPHGRVSEVDLHRSIGHVSGQGQGRVLSQFKWRVGFIQRLPDCAIYSCGVVRARREQIRYVTWIPWARAMVTLATKSSTC